VTPLVLIDIGTLAAIASIIVAYSLAVR